MVDATPLASIPTLVSTARASYATGRTRPLAWRMSTLHRLRRLLAGHADVLVKALAADLAKPRAEAWSTEIGFTLADIDHTIAHLPRWLRPERVRTPLVAKPATSTIVPQPLGVVAVIAPWNYPVQLLLTPMVAAIAAGNAVVGKPSELVPASSAALAGLIGEMGDEAVTVVQGGVAETTELLAQRFDHILYTGNGHVGRIVMRAAAEHLTPVTLELGGKSPAIVSRHADIPLTARRIAWGKFLNAGQTCIAPDHVLVERAVHDQLVSALGETIREFYGDDPRSTPDFARIVNDQHFRRLERLLGCGRVAYGGRTDAATRFIAPTVLTGLRGDEPAMAEEIFGPILPVIAVETLDDAAAMVAAGDKPLALYVFSERADDNAAVLAATTSGGACVNGTMVHVANPYLPFGGVGPSGLGAYHGKFGFDTFSHRRSVQVRSTRVDPRVLYPPYTSAKERLIRYALAVPDPRDLVGRVRSRWRRS